MPGMKNTMHEFKSGELHSGSKKGPVVRSRAQAIAIGLSEERAAGEKVPPKKKGGKKKGAGKIHRAFAAHRALHEEG